MDEEEVLRERIREASAAMGTFGLDEESLWLIARYRPVFRIKLGRRKGESLLKRK